MKKILLVVLNLITMVLLFSANVFVETMGSGGSNGASIASWESNNYFDNVNLTMSGTGDMRNTSPSSGYTGASGTWNVMLNAVNEYFQIADINTSGYTNLSLSFGIRKNTTAENGSTFSIQISSDGSNWSSLTMPALPTGTGTATWYWRTCSGTIPSTTTLYIKFSESSTTEFRIDDVTLSGDYSSPTPSLIVNPSSLTDFSYTYNNGPSSEQTFSISGSNLTNNVTVSSEGTNYEISSSSGINFGTSLSFSPSNGTVSATVYVRMKANLFAGMYAPQNIVCSSQGATSQNVACSGTVYPAPPASGFEINFEGENETKTNYASGTVNLSGYNCDMTQALIGTDAVGDIKFGARSARLRYDGTTYGSITMLSNKSNGIGSVSFYCARANFSNDRTGTAPIFVVEYSSDGINWIQAGDAINLSGVDLLTYYSRDINQYGNLRIRIRQTGGDSSKRWNIDNIQITDYPYDYPEGKPVNVGGITVLVENGNANNGTGDIPNWNNTAFIPSHEFIFDLIGSGPWQITFTTTDNWGAYYQNVSWHPVQNVNGSIVMEITATKNLSVPVILGDQNPNLPVELTSFTADFTQSTTGDMYVSIKWTTQSETALAGYYIYRGTTNDLSAAEQIPSLIVPANSSHGASYEFIDREIQSGTTYYYWLQSMEMDGSSDFHGPVSVTVNEGGNITPPAIITETRLLNAYPNPFNPTTTLCYTLKERGQAKIEIYNVRGQLIRSFMPAPQDKGYYQIVWDGKDLNGTQASSGVYYVHMACGKYVSSQRIVLMK